MNEYEVLYLQIVQSIQMTECNIEHQKTAIDQQISYSSASYSASYIAATQSHIFTSVSDMDLVSGLTCLSDFASSLFQISNMFVIVMEEELYQAVLYRLEGDRLMQMSLQMSMPNMHIQDKDIVRLSVEDYKSYFTQQTKQIHDRKNNNEAITSNIWSFKSKELVKLGIIHLSHISPVTSDRCYGYILFAMHQADQWQ
ncbi:hypothetical protein EDC96DRAFT_545547 [Choanephora cucurbitarum]|nr:hypothetical protein EDC96DRAFT_545547 [Choanephora cucurbitarum]